MVSRLSIATMRSPRSRHAFAYTRLPISPVLKLGGSSLTNSTKRNVRAGAVGPAVQAAGDVLLLVVFASPWLVASPAGRAGPTANLRASARVAATPEALSLAAGESSTES